MVYKLLSLVYNRTNRTDDTGSPRKGSAMVQQVLDKQFEFNPDDLYQLKWLVDKADYFDMPLAGVNEDGEDTMVEVTNDFVLVWTFQENGWTRKNYYYIDGTVEELYER